MRDHRPHLFDAVRSLAVSQSSVVVTARPDQFVANTEAHSLRHYLSNANVCMRLLLLLLRLPLHMPCMALRPASMRSSSYVFGCASCMHATSRGVCDRASLIKQVEECSEYY